MRRLCPLNRYKLRSIPAWAIQRILAGGPDVWEIIAALRTTTGREQDRVTTVADQLGIHPRQVTIALGNAADHPDEIERRIATNQAALAQAEQAHRARQRLLDNA